MPRDVIMPALGMNQDEGIIVAWLKEAGDEVSEGDAILEVETDKATMEIEAEADGFLTGLRAKAGDSVPVGQVIATIAETAEEAEAAASGDQSGGDGAEARDPEPEAPAGDAGSGAAESGGASAVEGSKQIMPALGMSQDTGKIVAWLKAPGDAVEADEPILEIETDKATEEVPADTGGYLAAVFYGEGADVPVGGVIAIISAEKPAKPIGPDDGVSPPDAPEGAPSPSDGEKAENPAEAKKPASKDEEEAKTSPSAAKSGKAAPKGTGGRVLASPKARRLAAERGLDLQRLARSGHPQPFHVADLEKAAQLGSGAGGASGFEAGAGVSGMIALHEALAAEDAVPEAGRLIAAFAAGAWRDATDAEDIALRLTRPGADPVTLADPDRTATETDAEPSLVVRDLTDTRLTSLPSEGGLPTLTAARAGGAFRVTFDPGDADLTEDQTIALLTGVAERLEAPLRHLL